MAHKTTQLFCCSFVPLVIKITGSPINGIFYANALVCGFIYILLLLGIFLCVKNIATTKNIIWVSLLIMASAIHFNKFYTTIGLIDCSLSYAIFYALPIALLLIYFSFFYNAYLKNTIGVGKQIAALLIVIYISFGCPLVAPIIFIYCIVGLLFTLKNIQWRRFYFSKLHIAQIGFFLLVNIYSFLLSKHNSEFIQQISLFERYKLLLLGIKDLFVLNNGFLVIMETMLILFLIHLKSNTWQSVKFTIQFALIFCAIYLLLLPLGGYRSYRPHILRYDTFIPITITLIFCTIYMMIKLLNNNTSDNKRYVLLVITFFIVVNTFADKKIFWRINQCQKASLNTIYNNKNTAISIPKTCALGTWTPNEFNPADMRAMLTKIFQKWGILQPHQQLVN